MSRGLGDVYKRQVVVVVVAVIVVAVVAAAAVAAAVSTEAVATTTAEDGHGKPTTAVQHVQRRKAQKTQLLFPLV